MLTDSRSWTLSRGTLKLCKTTTLWTTLFCSQLSLTLTTAKGILNTSLTPTIQGRRMSKIKLVSDLVRNLTKQL